MDKELAASPRSATAAGAATGSARRSTTCWTAVDRNDGDHSKITRGDFRKIVDLCWQCKLCFNHCPYTPPHQWDIDFPRLMLRAKAARARAEGVTRQDAWLGNVDALGASAAPPPPSANFANDFGPARAVLEAVVGHREDPAPAEVPPQDLRPLVPRAAGRPAERGPKIALFFSCSVNYNEPQVGRDTVRPGDNGCTVSCPEQVCCGMPYLDGGDVAAATSNAKKNMKALRPGRAGGEVWCPSPPARTCSRRNIPTSSRARRSGRWPRPPRTSSSTWPAATRRGRSPPTSRARGRAHRLPDALPPAGAEHGLQDPRRHGLIPGTRTCTPSSRCTAMDGTWGMKKEYFPISLQTPRVAHEDGGGPPADLHDRLHALRPAARGGARERPAHP